MADNGGGAANDLYKVKKSEQHNMYTLMSGKNSTYWYILTNGTIGVADKGQLT